MKPLFLLSGLMLMFLTGCLRLEDFDHRHSGGVSLSHAMQASASGSKEPLHSSSSAELTLAEEDHPKSLAVIAETGGAAAMVDYDNKQYRWQVLADTAYLLPLNGEIEGFFRYALTPLAIESERHYLGIYVGGGSLDFKPGSLPEAAAQDPWMLEAGLAYRYYFNRPHVLFSPYLSAGLGAQLFHWDYREALQVDDATIHSDNLPAATGYAGVGVAVWRKSPVGLFGEAGFGGTIFVNQTDAGFDNDVFHDFGYFFLKAGLAVKF